ncbi:MAG: MauE/DoxX family redox-associated membrane protein [Bacteroidota bacterium]
MKILVHIIRCLIGLTFIYSGISKLYPIEPFELFIFDQNIFGLTVSAILARLIIGTEILLGIILIINIYSKNSIRISFFLLVVFTLFLSYLVIFKSEITNCNCFGDHLAFTPLESIFKNLILIGLIVILLLKNISFKIPYKILIVSILIAGSFSLPFILNPPDRFVINFRQEETGYQFDYEKLGELSYKGNNYNFKDEKAVICFYSMTCKYCKLTAQKIAITLKNNKLNPNIFYIFLGEESDLDQFWEEGKSPVIQYKILPPDQFFALSGLSLPSIYFIDNGVVVKKVGYRNLFESDFVEFFEK